MTNIENLTTFSMMFFCRRNSHKQLPYDLQKFGNIGGASFLC